MRQKDSRDIKNEYTDWCARDENCNRYDFKKYTGHWIRLAADWTFHREKQDTEVKKQSKRNSLISKKSAD